jgi:hypothetical protein
MALTGRRIENLVNIYLAACSQGLPICVSSTSFQKKALAGLNSLRQKEYQILVKSRIFDDLFHEKGGVLAILALEMIQSSGPVNFLMK